MPYVQIFLMSKSNLSRSSIIDSETKKCCCACYFYFELIFYYEFFNIGMPFADYHRLELTWFGNHAIIMEPFNAFGSICWN